MISASHLAEVNNASRALEFPHITSHMYYKIHSKSERLPPPRVALALLFFLFGGEPFPLIFIERHLSRDKNVKPYSTRFEFRTAFSTFFPHRKDARVPRHELYPRARDFPIFIHINPRKG